MVKKLFFELLQVSLGTRSQLSWKPNDAQWMLLLDVAQLQSVDTVLLGGLEKLPAEQRPQIHVLLEWIGMALTVEASSNLQVERAKVLSTKVSSVGFDNSILKGIAVARYYSQPLRRRSGDIDLWVNGRRKDVMMWLRSQYEVDHILWHTVNVGAFEDMPVEIHFHPAWLHNPFRNYRLQRWFRQMAGEKYKTVEGYNVMPVEFDVVYSLVHSFRHYLAEGLNMRYVCDYYYILKMCRAEGVHTNGSVEVIKSIGLSRFAGAMTYVLWKACGMNENHLLCKPDDKEGRFLLREIMREEQQNETVSRSCKRYWTMGVHYPGEVLWVYPWRVWHCGWRLTHKIYLLLGKRYESYTSD